MFEVKSQGLSLLAPEKHGFNIIPRDSHKNEIPYIIDKEAFEILGDNYGGCIVRKGIMADNRHLQAG